MSKISMAANAPATDCKTVVVAATPSRPEFIRLPIKGLCPFTGLSRSKIYALILPHESCCTAVEISRQIGIVIILFIMAAS